MKTDFRAWTLENLAKFAFEASEKIADQEAELRHMKSDLKTALTAYRELNRKKND